MDEEIIQKVRNKNYPYNYIGYNKKTYYQEGGRKRRSRRKSKKSKKTKRR